MPGFFSSGPEDGLLAVDEVGADHAGGHAGPQLVVLDDLHAGHPLVALRRARMLRGAAEEGGAVPGAVRRRGARHHAVVLGAEQDAAAAEQRREVLRGDLRFDVYREADLRFLVSDGDSVASLWSGLTSLFCRNGLGPNSKREGTLQTVSELE